MFKWVMPASRSIAATPATTITTAIRTATRKTTKAAAATTTTPAAATSTLTKRQLLSNALTTLVIIGALFVQTTSGFRSSIDANGAGRKLFGGYRITPKHCRATKTLPSSDPRSNGPTICMFNHECAQRGGEVVGACMDGFLFGACCQIPQTHELASTLINDAQNAYFQQHQQQQQQQHKVQQQQKLQQAAQSSYENYGEQAQQLEQQQLQQQQQQEQQQQQQLEHDYPQQGYAQPEQTYAQPEQTYAQPQQTYAQPEPEQQQHQPEQEQPQPEQQLSAEEQHLTSSQAIYDQQNLDKVYQQLGSTPSMSQSVQPSGASSAPAQDELSFTSSSTEQTQSQSSSVEFEQEAETNSNEVKVTEQPPPPIHVNKNSVKINTFSSPPGNDDFVMQVLATLPPEHIDDIVTFTTEVPNKISSATADRTSSESNSFEETPATTPRPKQQPKPKPQPVPQLAETMKRPVQHIKAKPKPNPAQQQSSNSHHHNHLLLDGGEFTHSDITHPGADADLVEDLQFSTGYGPQPVYVQPPQQQEQQQQQQQGYIGSSSTSTQPSAAAEDKYVLVPTYNNEKRPQAPAKHHSNPTTVSSITTHVDSIESIILQLNNSSHGPSYNVVSQQTPSYGYAPQETTAAATAQPPSYYQEQEQQQSESIKSQEQQAQQDYSYTTSASYDKVSEEEQQQDESGQSVELPTPRPTYSDEQSSVLDEHTMPATGYNDVNSPQAPQTHEFNKMPVMGIAYPVDMSYIEGESSSGYGQVSSASQEANTELTYQKITNTYTEPPPQAQSAAPARPSKPNRPVASYIGMVTMQNYNDQLPAEVSVSSHTTKVQEQYDATPDGYQQQTEKLSQSSVAPPQYEAAVEISSARPALVTASPKPRPKPTTKRPAPPKKQPTKKTQHQPQQPSQSYGGAGTSVEESPVTHIQVKLPALNYKPQQQVKQPGLNYNQEQQQQHHHQAPSTSSYDAPSAAPTVSYDPPATLSAGYDAPAAPTIGSHYESEPAPTLSYEQAAPAPVPVPAPSSLDYNEQPVASSPTRKPASVKPISTSYVSGPTTPRPPATVDYHYDKVPPLFMADDKLDAFIQSTAENILGSTPGNYQSPLYATASTPLHIQQPTNSYGGVTHKKPGFVQINITPKPGKPSVLITPKPTAINLATSGSWQQHQQEVNNKLAATTSSYGSYGSPANDFEDPGYFGMPAAGAGSSPVHLSFTQSTTETLFAPPPSDDKPAFPGYYGPTPIYPAFSVPGEKVGQVVEETYTSPNDFVNFPPVRNPNLNMSAASSAVTSDLELSTPAFVEDIVLKDKMHTLVHKLVASLQGNFEALADMIDETNATAATYAAGPVAGAGAGGNRKTTKKPVRIATTVRPKATTKKPVTRVSTKAPNKKTAATSTTRKPTATRRTTLPPSTTRRPSSKKPTKRISSTAKPTARPANDEIVDEEDEEDVNPSPHENEIEQEATLSSYGGANGRKIQCGVRPHVKSGRIVGGKGSTFGAFPWQVLVRESTWLGLFTKNKCGGVLITSRYVITAAHCQPGFLASLVAVMGEFDISGDLESKRPVTKNVKRVIVHRQYDPATFENDLALLEMDSPVQFDTHIVPICMPGDQADFTGRMATVTGWGRLKYGGGVPSVLQEVQVPIIENSVCQEMFHTAGHNKKILGSFLCAGYANGQKDSCEGDSGGPLVLQRPDGRYELAGTVSHGIKCAAPYLPGVYMRTTFYKPWLRSITGVK